MTKGVDDRFTKRRTVNFRDVHADQTFQRHADADVLEDVFLGLLNEGLDVSGEIVLVNDRGGGGSGEHGAAQSQWGGFAEEDVGLEAGVAAFLLAGFELGMRRGRQ